MLLPKTKPIILPRKQKSMLFSAIDHDNFFLICDNNVLIIQMHKDRLSGCMFAHVVEVVELCVFRS